MGENRNKTEQPREQYLRLIRLTFCYISGKMRESEKSGNLDDTTDLSHCYGSLGDSPHPLPHNLCFFGMGTASAEVQNQLTCMLSALTPGERPLSEAGLEDW